jgi:hypothetical protein
LSIDQAGNTPEAAVTRAARLERAVAYVVAGGVVIVAVAALLAAII